MDLNAGPSDLLCVQEHRNIIRKAIYFFMGDLRYIS